MQPRCFNSHLLHELPVVFSLHVTQVHAVDRDAGNNGTVKYKLGAITLYESTGNTKAGLQPCDQPSLSSHSTLRAKYTTLDLTDYFQIDPLSGSFSLKSALPDQLIDLSCRIAISARDGASVPMESTIHMCLTITDALDESDGLNRTGSTSGTSMRLRGRNSRTTFYLYVIAAISIVGLLASIAFVLSAYFLWHRPRSKTIRDGTTMIRFHEVNNMASRTNVDKMEYVTNYGSSYGSPSAMTLLPTAANGKLLFEIFKETSRPQNVDSCDIHKNGFHPLNCSQQ
ncbi:unnamed protein product [Echinostoma caproni]|uniref:Cadherin domain-containing protein n=1 Tax=Echinostoma caproni TaxID=27848 RepID=A0A183B1B2_9TREM|nr:unnamed protein product [Echinostoma caproni]